VAAKEPALTEDDLVWAKRMNMTPEEFIAFSTPKET
jgi:hypothetical protein